MNSPFFIVGVQRSGTTLLSKMLGRHSDIHMEDKAKSFRLIGAFDNMYDLLPHNLELKSEDFIKWILDNDKNERVKDVVSVELIDTSDSIRSLISSSLEKRLDQVDKKIWGDKAPNLQHYIKDLLLYVPDAKIIHIVRDGRATVASMKKRAYQNVILSADAWLQGNVFGLVNERILGRDNYHIIKYEELVSSPAEVISKVCMFLDIEYDSNTIDLGREKEEGKDNYVKPFFDVSRIDSWKSDLTKKEVVKIETIQASLLKHFGYEVKERQVVPVKFRKRAWLIFLDSAKLLFKRKKKGMKDWQIVEYNDSFKSRFGKFVMTIVALVFSKGIYKALFGRRLYKSSKKK